MHTNNLFSWRNKKKKYPHFLAEKCVLSVTIAAAAQSDLVCNVGICPEDLFSCYAAQICSSM